MPPHRLVLATCAALALAACSSGSPHASTASSTPPTSATSGGQATSTTTAAPATSLTATKASWSLPAKLSREAVVVDHDRLVVAGGLTTGDKTVGTVFGIDPTSGAATSLPALPTPVHDCAGALVGGRPVVFGGGNTSESSAVQALGSSPSVIGHLPTARADLATASAGDATYIVGGYDGKTAIGDVLRTTDGATFSVVVPKLPIAVRYPALAVQGNTLWIFGGELATGDTDAIQSVDLTTHAAAVVGHFAAPLGHANAFVLRGSVWVVGGRAGNAPSANIRRFDPVSHTVTVTGTLPAPVRDAAVAVVGDTAYLLGGQASAPINDVVLLR